MVYFPSSKTAKGVLIAAISLSFPLTITAAQAQDQPQDASRWGTGQELYDKVCGHCHKPAVAVGTPLTGRDLPAEYIRFIVRNGFNGMPAFPASFIDDESLAKLAEYLASQPAKAQP